MSSISSWVYTDIVTVWPDGGINDWGETEPYGAPFKLFCSFIVGGDIQTDENGNEFSPDTTIYYEPDDLGRTVNTDDRVLIGDFTSSAQPPASSERVLSSVRWSMSAFGESKDDFAAYTSKKSR